MGKRKLFTEPNCNVRFFCVFKLLHNYNLISRIPPISKMRGGNQRFLKPTRPKLYDCQMIGGLTLICGLKMCYHYATNSPVLWIIYIS